jgi:hypothetical protein
MLLLLLLLLLGVVVVVVCDDVWVDLILGLDFLGCGGWLNELEWDGVVELVLILVWWLELLLGWLHGTCKDRVVNELLLLLLLVVVLVVVVVVVLMLVLVGLIRLLGLQWVAIVDILWLDLLILWMVILLLLLIVRRDPHHHRRWGCCMDNFTLWDCYWL